MLSFGELLANVEDTDIPQCVANGDEAIALIREDHSQVDSQWNAKKRNGPANCSVHNL
jgi:hypothetical protein